MLLNKFLILLIGYFSVAFITCILHFSIFRSTKSTGLKLALSLPLIYALIYGFIIFVIENEGRGTGLDGSFSDFLSTLPLFLFIFIVGFVFTTLPIYVLLAMNIKPRSK